ncbi:SDR family NAD(P)-dependent oxidoreductase, partial [Streptomyces sp. NPDC058051]
RDDDSPSRLLTGLATGFVHGMDVDWGRLLPGARTVPLPTYAFQHERFWWQQPQLTGGDPLAWGQRATGHPLLGAVVTMADGDGLLLTGRMSPRAQPWLAEHPTSPPSVLAELAMHAGEQTGFPRIGELIIDQPLQLPEHHAVELQIIITAPVGPGTRSIAIYSRSQLDGHPDAEDIAWQRHAHGTLVPAESDPATDSGARGASGAATGSPLSDGIHADVELPEDEPDEGYLIHPSLLDAAVRLAMPASGLSQESAYAGMQVYAVGARALRVHVTPADDRTVSIEAADPAGAPVFAIQRLSTRPVTAEHLDRTPAGSEGLYHLDWLDHTLRPTDEDNPAWPVLELAGGGDLAAAVSQVLEGGLLRSMDDPALSTDERGLVVCVGSGDGSPAQVTKLLLGVAGVLGQWLTGGRKPVMVVTRNAVPAEEGETDVAAAALWGLLRSAQSDHPGQLTIVDVDDDPASTAVLPQLIAADVPQTAVRAGRVLVPRLNRVTPSETGQPLPGDHNGTVLVTGGTGMVGAAVAEHLAAAGFRHLLLVSRRGEQAPNAHELVEGLAAKGAEARVAGCDVADLEALAELLAGIPEAHPLTVVIHAAGIGRPNVPIEALTADHLETMFAAKAVGAWNLHQLTQDVDLAGFVLFSSLAGTLSTAGQASYAAANAFLDGLAANRQSRGLPGLSVMWGQWAQESGLSGLLDEAGRSVLARAGMSALTTDHAVVLLDGAMADGRSNVAAASFDTPRLETLARVGGLPGLLEGIVRMPMRRAAAVSAGGTGGLAGQLSLLSELEQRKRLMELVRKHAAMALGHSEPDSVYLKVPFKELGFDSLTAIEFRGRLGTATGLTLPATLVFDHPTPEAVVGYLRSVLMGEPESVRHVAPSAPTDIAQDPMVIVGMACRYPGGVASAEDLWRLVESGVDAVGEFPTDRGWDVEGLYDPDPDRSGTSYAREGGFL